MKATFDTSAYWQERVGTDADLGIVGHRSLGVPYNEFIYRRRVDVLVDALDDLGIDASKQRVLDIGCGSGFYTRFWSALGVANYTGLDISTDAVTRLSGEFDQFQFVHADISVSDDLDETVEQANVVTVFDVFYHIVDDRKFAAALVNIAEKLKPGGVLLVFDQLAKRDYSLQPHVKFRSRIMYEQQLAEAGLEISATHHLFNILVPPMFANRLFDIPIAAIYKVLGLPMRAIPALGRLVGWCLFQADKLLHGLGVKIPNNQFFVIQHKTSNNDND